MPNPVNMPPGSIVLDVIGTELTDDDRRRLAHPQTGGVILFTRNYESPQQLEQLTREIHALRRPPLLIMADQEGGRVQRFREGFTALPAMRELGVLWDEDSVHARRLARCTGHVLAAELRAHGVDLSLTPVLDIDHGRSSVIGDRAFHHDPQAIGELASGLIHGMRDAGMSSVGKHFPGHGHVAVDSHHELPVDNRSYAGIEAVDMVPFRRLIGNGLGGMMPAHVVYPQVDQRPAGFSEIWLKQILRGTLGFDGVIFSDDLSMAGARWAGGIVQRAQAALDAGCDMVLVCNDAQAADELLAGLDHPLPALGMVRLLRLHGHSATESPAQLARDPVYLEAVATVRTIGARNGELPLYR
ncbi:MAG TPA: beta-N-acetylhexosaminidase [Burkholderiales bacterium]|nr:beta-N-acetylhexosaminidase [Burkholderiales bacterium]